MISQKLNWYGKALSNLGAAALARRQISSRFLRSKPYRLTSKYAAHDLWCRPGTSDLAVFDQIFTHREYRCLDGPDLSGLILDCGANVGYSSAYLLTAFPNCRVIAVEPHPDNFSVLRENLKPFAGRHECINAAVWSHPTRLALDLASSGGGLEWGREYFQSDGDTVATDIPSLLKSSHANRIALLKMDIEGAEEQVFSAKDISWLSATDNIVIELHGEKRREIFMNAIEGHGFSVSKCDELTVCCRK